jgi:flagellar hook-basal body complex protein FliE
LIDPLKLNSIPGILPPAGGDTCGAPSGPAPTADGKEFKSFLMDRLNEVNQLQKQADEGVERLVTGQTDNVAEVLGTVKKAEVAFSLLMEIRNKLMDAYSEIRQMRV